MSQDQPQRPQATFELAHVNPISIGETLEVTTVSVGDQPVTLSDAAAIQAAEIRATGSKDVGFLSSVAQSAATLNAQLLNSDDKLVTLGDVLEDATLCLAADKEVTLEDAEGVASATPDLAANPRGVGATLATAAMLNEHSK